MKTVARTVLLVGSAFSECAFAQVSAKPEMSALAALLDESGITTSGYVASSYYHSNRQSTYHQFDVEHDTFQLDQAAFTVAYQPKQGFGALLNLAAGEDIRILHAAEDGIDNTFDIVQGFVQYAGGPLTIIAGKYVTLAGAEVIAPTGNTNFSRSFLFFAEPLTHTGIRATYAVTDSFSVIAGVNNGWNTTSTSYGPKTAEFGVGFTPSKRFALTAQTYIGKTPGYDAQKVLFDTVATFNANDALSFVLSYDWGSQDQAGSLQNLRWNGLAGYANLAISDRWRLSVRAEYLNDLDGFVSGTAQKLKEGTVTVGFTPAKNFELRLEGRYDKSSDNAFVRSADPSDPLQNSQTGFAVQGVFKF